MPDRGVGQPVLSVRDLVVEFSTPAGVVRAVDGLSYDVHGGETLGVVGETGSGKSVSVLAALGLLQTANLRRVSGEVMLGGVDLLSLPEAELRRRLGRDVAMIFQDAISALNPVQRVGDQIAEALRVHDRAMSADAAWERVVELLELVGVPHPRARYDQYPHQFSGGMCQRVMIAMAIANRPKVLIADEPTTALDVSVQAQILDVLRLAREETGAGVVLITHDLGVVAETADRAAVTYGGRIVETGEVTSIFTRPRHPYTAALMRALPRLDSTAERLLPIPGQPPDLTEIPPGCAFAPRCPISRGRAVCVQTRPALRADDADTGTSACHFPDEAATRPGTEDGVPAPSGDVARTVSPSGDVARTVAVSRVRRWSVGSSAGRRGWSAARPR
ncbi:ABC transporter ATP-binding protein [Micromonospora sp. WMMD1102]|uniref:ABC transporter ATP-binding protein n=1 Tax=Micromonospora sp. WMMD1102 TaxID=3016105 RepID=UPI00241556DA|nr:ABC transporter ATP-binding protein [Micromonospora sp. WMMD1102]MDG4788051.1 ABC transporter ATP-binding protein [Micromonospora sp. WMMD1102]